MSLAALAGRLRGGELSPREAVEHYLARIEAHDATVNSYITVMGDEALAEADRLGRADQRARGPLWGVPVAVKDVIDVAGVTTTCGSHLTEGAAPAERDAATVAGLRRAGAIILGKLNTHEFAYGAMTTSPRFGPGHNPWSLERIVGGSSGGSGAAAAARLAAGTLGTDTAGSVRIPAAFNGVSGLRPTTGRVSNRGVFPVSFTLRHRRSARAKRRGLRAAARRDRRLRCTGSLDRRRSGARLRWATLGGGVSGVRIGVVRSLLAGDIDARIAEAVAAAIDQLRESLGAQVSDVEIPAVEHFGTIQQAMQFSDATQVHRADPSDAASRPTATTCEHGSSRASSFPRPSTRPASERVASPTRRCAGCSAMLRPARGPDDACAAAPRRRGHGRAQRRDDALSPDDHPVQLALEPRRATRAERSVRLRRRSCPSAMALIGWRFAESSTCCGRVTPTSRRPTGTTKEPPLTSND